MMGPLGGELIGDAPYREVAEAEGLSVERPCRDGGLVPSFEQLRSPASIPAGPSRWCASSTNTRRASG
jgi:hypothetical protein